MSTTTAAAVETRYGCRSVQDGQGPVAVTCMLCGCTTTGPICRYVRAVPSSPPEWWCGIRLLDYVSVVTCFDCGEIKQYLLEPFYSCQRCNRTVYSDRNNARYCCDQCQQADKIDRRRVARQLAREKSCEKCGRKYTAARADSHYCSSSCRQAAYRNRAIERAAKRAEDARVLAEYNEGLY